MSFRLIHAVVIASVLSTPALAQVAAGERPTNEEATVAWAKADARMSLMPNDYSEKRVELGECAKSQSGPGIICTAGVKVTPEAKPAYYVKLGFSKSAGEWVATFER
ncbi:MULTISPECIES: hypothetical protein [Rhizobium/Agrobacterium group]|uniref:hypothetical protein n=1 Tax=Rhizobium/Agrobacterium group TaxID=227290 RepID=UPI000BCB2FC6|nr:MULTISPECIES: hypothetical protein [Rhizobium/Agrobacterium group]NTA19137.1 hypothetical protein [Agrobacterium tumefaciens]WCK74639.1 hypothetical protein G6L96_024475 [Agrobacterium tumefaciens]SOC90304.1 hypothetical protein SAMN05216358_0352 [Rhizobium sp. AN5]